MSARDMFALVDDTPDDIGLSANYDPAAHGGERDGTTQAFLHWPGYDIRDAASRGNVTSERATLRDIESSAMRRGWWGVPYDVGVGMSGRKYGLRGLARSGATSGDVDDDGSHNNDEGEAILLLMSPDDVPSEAMLASLKELLDAFDGDEWGHRNAGGIATACPGELILQWLEDYQDGELKPPPLKPTPKPKPEPDEVDYSWDGGDVYTVKKGNTLYGISRVVDVGVPQLAQWNNLKDIDSLDVGQKLVVTEPMTDDGSYTVKVDRRTIKIKEGLGSTNGSQLVKIAQALLLAHGSSSSGLLGRNGKPDGKFGWGTHRRVEEFQRREGLAVDGIIGPNTWAALEKGD